MLKTLAKNAGAVALVVLAVVVLIAMIIFSLPSPTPAERGAFDRWQADQESNQRENARKDGE